MNDGNRSPLIRRALVGAILTLLGPLPSHAQTGSLPNSGTRIRLTTPERDSREAVVDSLPGDGTLLVRLEGRDALLRIEPGGPYRMEVWNGRRPHPLKGMLIGGLVGVAGGAVAGAILSDPGQSFGDGHGALYGAYTFGILGTLGGLVVGTLVWTDRWAPVAIDDDRPSLGPLVVEGRLGVGLRVPIRSP